MIKDFLVQHSTRKRGVKEEYNTHKKLQSKRNGNPPPPSRRLNLAQMGKGKQVPANGLMFCEWFYALPVYLVCLLPCATLPCL